MDNTNQRKLIDIIDLKDLLGDLAHILQQDPVILAIKRIFQSFMPVENQNENLFSTIFDKLNRQIRAITGSIDINELYNLLSDLVDILEPKISASAIKRVLQCVFTLVQKKIVFVSPKVYEKLISARTATFNENSDAASSNELRLVLSDVMECFQKQVEDNELLNQLSLLDPNCDIDQFLKVIQKQLQSRQKEERESAYFQMHKLLEMFDSENDVTEAIKCTKDQWLEYIAAMEDLEELRMPLRLFSLLENLKCHNDFSPWLRILYLRLFQSDSILIAYETVRYIGTDFKISHLNEWDLLKEFLKATNRSEMYDNDDDDKDVKVFISICESGSIIETLLQMPLKWNIVPLCEWLKSLPMEQKGHSPCISKETLFKLSSLVEKMSRSEQMYEGTNFFESKFGATLDSLSLEDYLIYIETMYSNTFWFYTDYGRMQQKLESCDIFDVIPLFSRARLEIILRKEMPNVVVNNFIKELGKVPRVRHGWFRFFFISYTSYKMVSDFYSKEYGVDISLIVTTRDLNKLQEHLLKKLKCETKEEKTLVHKLSIDCFVRNQAVTLVKILDFKIKPAKVIEQGGELTFTQLFRGFRINEKDALPSFIAFLKKYPNYSKAYEIGQYASKLNHEEQLIVSQQIISDHFHANFIVVIGLLECQIRVRQDQVIQGLCHCLTLTADDWNDRPENIIVPITFISYVLRQPALYIEEVCDALLCFNKEVSERYPNYSINSKEHKERFCIALSLLLLTKNYECSDQLWSALFAPNEQLNITLLYEMIVAKTLRDPKILIERLQAIAGLEPNQQVSLLSVAHIFLHSNLVLDRNTGITDDQIKMICESIFSLIEVENFNVHQFAILVVEKLMNKYEEFGKYFPIKNASRTSAEDNLAPHIEARYILPEVYCANSSWDYTKHNYKAFSYAFFISNTAVYYFNEDKLKVSCQLRKAIKSAQQVADKVEELKLTNKVPINQHEPVTRTKSANITPVQQAPAPQYRSAKSNGELIVVSACNDDVNSLNDLIRSCESFGVQTLVLSGTRNLSSETEGELPILKVKPELLDDYLSVKKMEKFHIVGIENIERSYTLKHFDSAQKTILVLGHDRHGTPENLRNLLDCTIQLPLEDVQRLQQLPIFMYSKQFLKTI